jgi:hypothetical protein
LNRVVEYLFSGNRSAFLRLARKRVETLQRAERLRELQTSGVAQRAQMGLENVPVEEIVHRVLGKRDE